MLAYADAPKLTQALQRQSAGVGSWHITLPPLFLIQVIFLFLFLFFYVGHHRAPAPLAHPK